jgi:hypothetical protein
VTELARAMTRLRGFVHVSTAYTNCDMPKRAVVHERVFPLLAASGKPVDIDALAAELMALPPADAQAQVRAARARAVCPLDPWPHRLPHSMCVSSARMLCGLRRVGSRAGTVRSARSRLFRSSIFHKCTAGCQAATPCQARRVAFSCADK